MQTYLAPKKRLIPSFAVCGIFEVLLRQDMELLPNRAELYLLKSVRNECIIAKGVSNENGFFVIPCNAAKVMARISYVGYQTVEMVCSCHPTIF